MKQLLATTLLLLAATVGRSQQSEPKIYFGDFGQMNPKGVPRSVVTTQAKVLAKPRIYTERGCELLAYTVSVLPKGGGIKGPMSGKTELIPDRITEWVVSMGTSAIIYVENIHVLCNDEPREVSPFTIKYEQ